MTFQKGNFCGRYSDILRELLGDLGGIAVLRESFEDEYQGFVDVDILLEYDIIFSYNYSYGSCSTCDEWEKRDLSDSEIKDIMKSEATFFDGMTQYIEWRRRVEEKNGN